MSDRPISKWLDAGAWAVPWGVITFLLLAIGGLVAVLVTPYEFKDYLPGIAAGSGLLGVGHGIRGHRRD